MLDFTTITVDVLKFLANFTGSYGLAIVVLTVGIRLIMWPLSTSQQRSMKKMQTLSPKIKELQARYKSDPQLMQKKMMEFYKEHKFNPFSGCLPMLLQLPIFILLYQALMSPLFVATAGNSSFLFIKRLDSSMRSHSGILKDGKFGVADNDTFSTTTLAKVYLKDGTVKEIKLSNPGKAIEKQGTLIPGNPVDLKIKLDSFNADFSELEKIQKADIAVTNNATKEIEQIVFNRKGDLLTAEVPTTKSETTFHYDVLVLVLLFGITMYLSQKYTMDANKGNAMDAGQQAMQQSMANIMPIMITAMFVFVPIPAGVLLYMVASNVIQVVQTIMINKQIDAETATATTITIK